MKNTENAAIPMSAIDKRTFRPRRLSAKPPQVCRTNPSKSVTTATGSLNQKVRRSGSEKILKNRPQRHNENCWPSGRHLLMFAIAMAMLQLCAIVLLQGGIEAIPRFILWSALGVGSIVGTVFHAISLARH